MHGLWLEQGGEGGVGGGLAQDPRAGLVWFVQLVCSVWLVSNLTQESGTGLVCSFGLVWSLGWAGFEPCTGPRILGAGLVWFGHGVWLG